MHGQNVARISEQADYMSDMLMGAIFGVLATCAVLLAMAKSGLIHMGRKQEEPEPVAPRLNVRLGCSITVEEKTEPASGLAPQVRLFATIENEGKAAVRSLRGHWKVVTQDNFKHEPVQITRDVLAPHDRYLESYLLADGMDTQAEGARFDVLVDFDYMADADMLHYTAKYRYDRKNRRMIRL